MSKELIVVKSNDLVEASYKLTLDEMRVLLLTLGVLDPDNPQREFEFTVVDFAKRFGLDDKVAYQQVSNAIDRLGGRWAVIEKTKKVERKVTFLTEQAYFKGDGRFQIVLHEKLMPYISKLKGRFTQYNLDYIVNFKGFHSIRLYELMAQYLNKGFRAVTVAELKDWLQVGDKYPRYNNFKQWVIEPSINEINKKSDLFVEYEQIKRGRSIHALRFTIKQKNSALNADVDSVNCPNLPPRPQVKKGSDLEGKWAIECINLIENHRKLLEKENKKLSIDCLKKLEKFYLIVGDKSRVEKIQAAVERRLNHEENN